MSPNYRLFAAVALFAVSTVCWSGLSSPSSAQEKKGEPVVAAPAVPKWEYKIVMLDADNAQAEKEINKLGDEGWELVGTASDTVANPGGGRISTKVKLFFKRPKK